MQNFTSNLDSSEELKLTLLKESFQKLDAITDPILFAVEFESFQKKSKLRLTTFREAYKAWCAQRQAEGGAA